MTLQKRESTKAPSPTTPGEILLEEFMIPFGITADRLAKEIYVPARHIKEIIEAKRSVTAEIDLRLCRFFKLSDGYWSRAQIAHDIMLTRLKLGEELMTIKPWSIQCRNDQ